MNMGGNGYTNLNIYILSCVLKLEMICWGLTVITGSLFHPTGAAMAKLTPAYCLFLVGIEKA